MITLTCECCGFTEEFASAKAAYDAGWDEPEHFPSGPVTCGFCPSSPFVMGGVDAARERHAPVHAKWEKEGRPTEFDIVGELELDNLSEEDKQEALKAARMLGILQ